MSNNELYFQLDVLTNRLHVYIQYNVIYAILQTKPMWGKKCSLLAAVKNALIVSNY